MKKVILILLAVSIVFIFSGFAIVAATGFTTAARFGVSDKDIYKTPITQNKEVDLSSCDKIDLTLVNAQVKIETYDGNTIKLAYDEHYSNEWVYSFSDSTLSLKYHHNNWIYDLFSFINMVRDNQLADSKTNVTLLVPVDSDLTYIINEVNDNSTLSNIKAKQITLSGVNTGTTINDVSSENEITAKNVNGSYKLHNVKADSIKLDGMVNSGFDADTCDFGSISADDYVNGHLTLKGLVNKDDYYVRYQLVNGHIDFDNDTLNGNGSVGSSNAKYSIIFHGVNSDLNLEFAK
jgi:hypothetical protein